MKHILALTLIIVTYSSQAQMIASNHGQQVADDIYVLDYSSESFIDQADFKKRDPGVAFVLSLLLPGGGQFYNGQGGKGAVMLGTSLLGVILYANGTKTEEVNILGGNVTTQKSSGTAATGVALIVVSGLWSMIDAPIIASKLNKKNGITLNIDPALQLNPSGGLAYGPRVRFNF